MPNTLEAFSRAGASSARAAMFSARKLSSSAAVRGETSPPPAAEDMIKARRGRGEAWGNERIGDQGVCAIQFWGEKYQKMREFISTLVMRSQTQVSDILKCGLCLGQLEDPCACALCGISYCRDCWDSVLASSARCPSCRDALDTLPVPNLALRDLLTGGFLQRPLLVPALASAGALPRARAWAAPVQAPRRRARSISFRGGSNWEAFEYDDDDDDDDDDRVVGITSIRRPTVSSSCAGQLPPACPASPLP
jgi:hypothetical protein